MQLLVDPILVGQTNDISPFIPFYFSIDLTFCLPAPFHRGFMHAQTRDRGLPEEVQCQKEAKGILYPNPDSQVHLYQMGLLY